VAADRNVFWKSDRVLRFFPLGGLYRRRVDVRGGTRHPHTGVARGRKQETGTVALVNRLVPENA
jgi:hypothetical protein